MAVFRGALVRLVLLGALVLLSVLPVPGAASPGEVRSGILDGGRLFVPLRGVLEDLGAAVHWDEAAREAVVRLGGRAVRLKPGSALAEVSGQAVRLDAPARLVGGRVYVPLRFVAGALGARVEWDGTAAVLSLGGRTVRVVPSAGGVRAYYRQVAVGGRAVRAAVVEVPHGAARPDVVLARDRVGATEWLDSMARRAGAVAAINGTFFEAYGNGPPEPWGTIIKRGRVVHVGGAQKGPGTTIGFTGDGRVKVEHLRVEVRGAINGSWAWPNDWYAYGFNRTPSANGAYIFTPERGRTLGFARGFSAVVSRGVVVGTAWDRDVEIPRDGFVVNFTGSETYLAGRFKVGDRVEYKVTFTDAEGREVDWSDVLTAVGAGPLLVRGGRAIADPAAEGFASAKILSGAGARSAVGVKPDGTVMLVSVPGATIKEMALVMKALGAQDAVNLDGGASSGLWHAGRYLARPGRPVSNALVFVAN